MARAVRLAVASFRMTSNSTVVTPLYVVGKGGTSEAWLSREGKKVIFREYIFKKSFCKLQVPQL